MKTPRPISFLFHALILATGAVALFFHSMEPASAAPPPDPVPAASQTNSAVAKAVSPSGPVAIKRQLTGAELYSVHCNRCHPERYPTERTAAQWKTIMLHMQVRANLPVSQAKLILKYLQDNSGR